MKRKSKPSDRELAEDRLPTPIGAPDKDLPMHVFVRWMVPKHIPVDRWWVLRNKHWKRQQPRSVAESSKTT
jgi:hypothetical protein